MPIHDTVQIMEQLTGLSECFQQKCTPVSIVCNDLSLRLSGSLILDTISFGIDAGAVHCIIGPNGGGKSSLLKSFIGQMPHTGSIDIIGAPCPIIGYMPQMLDFDRTLPITVYDFMTLVCQNTPAFLGIKRQYKKAVDICMEITGMQEKKNRLLGQLSGGEKQRVLLAQALYPLPDLLLLDEPMAGIDSDFTPVFESIISALKAIGVTIVWINHNIEQVKALADAVTCIDTRLIFSEKILPSINTITFSGITYHTASLNGTSTQKGERSL